VDLTGNIALTHNQSVGGMMNQPFRKPYLYNHVAHCFIMMTSQHYYMSAANSSSSSSSNNDTTEITTASQNNARLYQLLYIQSNTF